MPYESADIVRLTSFRGHLGRLERRSSCAWFFSPRGNFFVTGWCFFPECLPLIFKHTTPQILTWNLKNAWFPNFRKSPIPFGAIFRWFHVKFWESSEFWHLNQIHPARGSCFLGIETVDPPLCIQWTCLKKINATIPWWVSAFIFLQDQ